MKQTFTNQSNDQSIVTQKNYGIFRFLRGILTIMLLITFTLSYGFPIEFKKSYPESGSTISSFNFILEFDITDALEKAAADKPDTEVGIGYTGNDAGYNATLYKGDAETGEMLGKAMASTFNGKAADFVVNGNTIKLNFDSSIPIIANQEYTIKISNLFYMYVNGKVTRVTSTASDYSTAPIILKFVGADLGDSQLYVKDSSLHNVDNLDKVKIVEFHLSAPFVIKSGAEVLLNDGDTVEARTSDLKVSATDEKTLIADFGADIPLNLGHTYTMLLPKESVTHHSNAAVGNMQYSTKINGTTAINIPIKSHDPVNDYKGLVGNVTINFDIPTGYTLTSTSGNSPKGLLYINEISEENLVSTLTGKVTADGKGHTFDLSVIPYIPSSKYIFVKPANEITVWKDGIKQPQFGCEETSICWTTPSVEETDIPSLKIGTVKIGRHDNADSPEFVNGGIYSNIDSIEFDGQDYVYNGETYSYTSNYKDAVIYIYDTTGGNRRVVKETKITVVSRVNLIKYGAFKIDLQMDFLQDHSYEIVIPKGKLVLNGSRNMLYNYITNDEIVFSLNGNTPADFAIESCSVEENAEMSTMPPVIIWTLHGAYNLKSNNIYATSMQTKEGSIVGYSNQHPMTIYKENWNTYVSVMLTDVKTGEPLKLHKDFDFKLTIPAGSIIHPSDETVSNPEINLTLKGIEEVVEIPEVPEAELVNVNLTVNGLHSITHQAAKGKVYTLTLTPDENWSVESVMLADTALTFDNGVYVTEPLNEDADITATLTYKGEWAVENTSGVWEISDSNIRIYKVNNQIIVEGVSASSHIAVYSAAGVLINTATATEGNDIIKISVATGQVYIVTVNGKAAKLQF